jgi:hypothetical protein
VCAAIGRGRIRPISAGPTSDGRAILKRLTGRKFQRHAVRDREGSYIEAQLIAELLICCEDYAAKYCISQASEPAHQSDSHIRSTGTPIDSCFIVRRIVLLPSSATIVRSLGAPLSILGIFPPTAAPAALL